MKTTNTPAAPAVDLPRPTDTESFTAWLYRVSKVFGAPEHLRKGQVRSQLKAVRGVGLDPTSLANDVLRTLGERQAEAAIPR